MEGSNDNDYFFEPHSAVYEKHDEEGGDETGSEFFEPKELWHEVIEYKHTPVGPPIRTEHAIPESICFPLNVAVSEGE
jgi:hypothetical protein